MIGKSRKPRCFKHTDMSTLPVKYQAILKDWFHHEFIPNVSHYLISLGLEPKAVLILDNAPSHPEHHELQSENGYFVARHRISRRHMTCVLETSGLHSAQSMIFSRYLVASLQLIIGGGDMGSLSYSISSTNIHVVLSCTASSTMLESSRSSYPGPSSC